MKKISINYKNNIQKKYLDITLDRNLRRKYLKVLDNLKYNLEKKQNLLNSFNQDFKLNFNSKNLSRFKKFKTVTVIGMGGSILGTEAIHHFLGQKVKKEFIFLNDLNEDHIKSVKRKNLKKTLFIIISKSGKTIETLLNLYSLKILKRNAKNIIIISEKNNPLFNLTKKMNLIHIDHRKYIGGRFSIFSEVSILPALLMGLNLKKFKKNLLKHIKIKKNNFLKNSAISLSNILLKKRFNNLIFFNYEPKLDKFLEWGQQLISESLGKNGKGFLPVISKAPKDHHSLLQLYLAGPKDKIFYIFSSKTNNNKPNQIKEIEKEINFLRNKNFSKIKNAQKSAFVQILKRNGIPFREFVLNNFDDSALGELFSYFILETILIGKLSNINPFDQPDVETVKIGTKKILI